MTSKSEIESLIQLMEDPDLIQQSVQDRFTELGINTVPLLDEFRIETKTKMKNRR